MKIMVNVLIALNSAILVLYLILSPGTKLIGTPLNPPYVLAISSLLTITIVLRLFYLNGCLQQLIADDNDNNSFDSLVHHIVACIILSPVIALAGLHTGYAAQEGLSIILIAPFILMVIQAMILWLYIAMYKANMAFKVIVGCSLSNCAYKFTQCIFLYHVFLFPIMMDTNTDPKQNITLLGMLAISIVPIVGSFISLLKLKGMFLVYGETKLTPCIKSIEYIQYLQKTTPITIAYYNLREILVTVPFVLYYCWGCIKFRGFSNTAVYQYEMLILVACILIFVWSGNTLTYTLQKVYLAFEEKNMTVTLKRKVIAIVVNRIFTYVTISQICVFLMKPEYTLIANVCTTITFIVAVIVDTLITIRIEKQLPSVESSTQSL